MSELVAGQLLKVRIPLLFAAVFLFAFAVSGLLEFVSPHETDFAAVAGEICGRGLLLWVLSAVVPLARSRGFQLQRLDDNIFITWGIFVILLGIILFIGHERHLDKEVSTEVTGGRLTASAREHFVRSAIQKCVLSQTANDANIQANVSPEAIAAYCRCVSEASADTITEAELKLIVQGGVPETLKARTLALAAKCSARVAPR